MQLFVVLRKNMPHKHTHASMWSLAVTLSYIGWCVDHKTHSWRLLLPTPTPPSSSIVHTLPPFHTHTLVHTLVRWSPPRLPVPCSKLSAVPICMSGYQRSNYIPFLSCKIHCAEPPPSHPPPSSSPSPPPSVYWPGRCKSIPLFIPPKMPLFQV